MEHLNSRFKLLVDAIRLDHSFAEIASLADVLDNTALRLFKRDEFKGIRIYLKNIMKSTRYIKVGTENCIKEHGKLGEYSMEQPIKIIELNDQLEEIQKNIQIIAKSLKIELKEAIK